VLNGPRVNLTLVLDKPYDAAVVFFVVPGAQFAGRPHPAYYVPLEANVTVLVRVKNAGEKPSPSALLNITQWSADPVSWENRESRALLPLPVPALAPGESANFSFVVYTDEWGGQQEKKTECFHSLSYRTNVEARVTGAESGDFGPWDDASTISLHAFRVEGNETAPCGTGGEGLIPYFIAVTLGAFVAVWLVTRYFSGSAEERRAARRAEQERERELAGNGPPERP
jgi:hypothetical protein